MFIESSLQRKQHFKRIYPFCILDSGILHCLLKGKLTHQNIESCLINFFAQLLEYEFIFVTSILIGKRAQRHYMHSRQKPTEMMDLPSDDIVESRVSWVEQQEQS